MYYFYNLIARAKGDSKWMEKWKESGNQLENLFISIKINDSALCLFMEDFFPGAVSMRMTIHEIKSLLNNFIIVIIILFDIFHKLYV